MDTVSHPLRGSAVCLYHFSPAAGDATHHAIVAYSRPNAKSSAVRVGRYPARGHPSRGRPQPPPPRRGSTAASASAWPRRRPNLLLPRALSRTQVGEVDGVRALEFHGEDGALVVAVAGRQHGEEGRRRGEEGGPPAPAAPAVSTTVKGGRAELPCRGSTRRPTDGGGSLLRRAASRPAAGGGAPALPCRLAPGEGCSQRSCQQRCWPCACRGRRRPRASLKCQLHHNQSVASQIGRSEMGRREQSRPSRT